MRWYTTVDPHGEINKNFKTFLDDCAKDAAARLFEKGDVYYSFNEMKSLAQTRILNTISSAITRSQAGYFRQVLRSYASVNRAGAGGRFSG